MFINKPFVFLSALILNQTIALSCPQIALADHCETITDICSWYSDESYIAEERCVRTDGLPDFEFSLQESMKIGVLIEARNTEANPMFYIEGITNDNNCESVLVENDSANHTERDSFPLTSGTYGIYVGNSGESTWYDIHIYACKGEGYYIDDIHHYECWDDR